MDPKPDKECEKHGDIVLVSGIIANSMYWQATCIRNSIKLGLILEHITNFDVVRIFNTSVFFQKTGEPQYVEHLIF
jgi:hypothetical protein